jgi:hypothetical protein
MVEERLDLGPEERDQPRLVTRAEADLGGVRVRFHPVAQLVEDGHGSRAKGGLENIPRQPELGEEIGLDGPGPVGR